MVVARSPICSRSDAVARHVDALRRDGWCLVENAIPAPDLPRITQAIHGEISRQSAAWAATGTGGPGVAKAMGVIAGLGPLSRFLVAEPLAGVVRAMLGSYVRVSSDFAIVTQPGNERGAWHADWPYNQTMAARVPPPYDGGPPMHLSVLFMVTDFTVANGGTLFVSASHLRGDNPSSAPAADARAAQPDERHATGPAGTAFVYDARMWHAVAENRSREPRVALAARFAPWWLNLEVRRPGSAQQRLALELMDGRENTVAPIARGDIARLPDAVRPLYEHLVIAT
jgi:ectoine hydroxylase-related dioxygenase (phytanoyl-CoA dioxygenase family)